MSGKTFAEKIFGAKAGTILFKKPAIVLSHDNTASIAKTFSQMGGERVADPNQLLIVLDHNAPPTNATLANAYQAIRTFVKEQGISRFYDVGHGICHQLMSHHARPGMLIVGSDSHTCTAGAFNAFAAGIDRTETAGLWKQAETWFRVPETIKITLNGQLPVGVYAKDLSLWIIGMLGSSGADYRSIEFHGQGVASLSVSQRMTLANLASEMGAKNAAFPADEVLWDFLGEKTAGIWADADAQYVQHISIDLSELFPLVAAPHHVDNVKAVSEVQGTPLQQALVGTCTNGRLEDLQEVDAVIKNQQLPVGFQFLVIPAAKKIYQQAMKAGIIDRFMDAGISVLAPSCGPCLGTGQGIPADGYNVISTANRNFKGRMGNKSANIYLASPATVAVSALRGEITDPRGFHSDDRFPYTVAQSKTVTIADGENRYQAGVWNYADVDNLNTDQMFAGNLTYTIPSAEPAKIIPHLFEGFDPAFSKGLQKDDIILAGANFGCGSSREHPAVGLAYAGLQAVICKSVSRIFYRSSVNQGLPIIILPELVENYKPGDLLNVDLANGQVVLEKKIFQFAPLPAKLMGIFQARGLVNYLKQ